jgi:HSP20 family protein
MPISDLIPWRRERGEISTPEEKDQDTLLDIRDEMNRMFEDFFERPLGLSPLSRETSLRTSFMPDLDISDTEDEILVSAELPGMEPEDIDIQLSGNTLMISGEKSSEKEQKGKRYYRQERSYGSFRRSIPLPDEIDQDKIDASYQRGVLKVSLPKTAEAKKKSKSIPVKTK